MYQVPNRLGREETIFPTSFSPVDTKLAGATAIHLIKGPLNWYIDEKGSVTVWFTVESRPLFRCLPPHLPNENLWQSFEELKQELADGIKQVISIPGTNRASVNDALSLASDIAQTIAENTPSVP